MLKLRVYKNTDATVIVKWLKNEFVFHQWNANRYASYPCMGETWNCIEMEIIR